MRYTASVSARKMFKSICSMMAFGNSRANRKLWIVKGDSRITINVLCSRQEKKMRMVFGSSTGLQVHPTVYKLLQFLPFFFQKLIPFLFVFVSLSVFCVPYPGAMHIVQEEISSATDARMASLKSDVLLTRILFSTAARFPR